MLDQNIPRELTPWLKQLKPSWDIRHVVSEGLKGKGDRVIFDHAQQCQAIVVTFDEDFADQRSFPVGEHHGVIRLRVWPTTSEETQNALERLCREVTEEDLRGALVIIDRTRIRVRPRR